ncbi:hypothetical protein [Planomicrobium sp. YIM 101495]|uniref:hypothetical protein n=1 Tax=Planomicrobium sp. YIM 101495 TaxID=2665160 RepID=UPI0012B70704|nr:hypothetical protein [Planomicrobium sp. YIM 101495]MTD30700.1 hypothetical protein [Planomicrobium sp. YIM 101495]
MRKTDYVNKRKPQVGQTRILFVKDQDDFAKALREGTSAVEGITYTDQDLVNK